MSQEKLCTASSNQGLKFDEDKVRYDLLPTAPEREIAKVLTFGARKYADRNWEKGIAWNRLYRAARGHLQDWWNGQDNDPETGLSHLAHAGCCIMFLLEFLETHPELDNRPKRNNFGGVSGTCTGAVSGKSPRDLLDRLDSHTRARIAEEFADKSWADCAKPLRQTENGYKY